MLQSTMADNHRTDHGQTGRHQTEQGGEDVRLTVDQMARLAGTTTRNIRALQTLGLLHRPILRGRTGLYGQEHLDRLRAVLRLQGAGFSLGAVGVLFEAWERGLTLEQVLGVPPAAAGHGAPSDAGRDEPGPFDDWPALRAVPALAVVPTTVLEQVAS
jgi:DNA-binding transcriptional MerR regulator